MLPSRTRTLIRIAMLAGLLGLLTGCSRHTALTVKADLVPFMSSSRTHASVGYTAGSVDVKLPPSGTTPNPGELVDLGQLGVPQSTVDGIDALSLTLAASLTPSTAVDAGTATFYLADASATDAFDPTYQVAQVQTPAMPAGQATTVNASVLLDAQSHADALTRVRSGSFRLGVELRAGSGASGTVDVVLTRLVLSLSLPPGWGLP